MLEQIQIGRHSAEVFLPGPGPFASGVIYLHAYAGESLRDHPPFLEAFRKHQLPVLAPRGGRSWWLNVPASPFTPGTAAEFLRRDVVDWTRQHWGIEPPRLGLLGVTMGGQGALNLSYRHALQFPVVAAISPAIDFDRLHGRGFGVEELFPDAEAARQETATLHIHPLNWPRHQFFCCDRADTLWREGCERLASKLSSSGIPYACDLETSRGGHGWPYFHAMADRAVGFLAEGLKSVG